MSETETSLPPQDFSIFKLDALKVKYEEGIDMYMTVDRLLAKHQQFLINSDLLDKVMDMKEIIKSQNKLLDHQIRNFK